MTNEGTPLKRVVELLNDAQIPYMVTGSIASTFHGPSRATQDIDLVIDPTLTDLDRLLEHLSPDLYYVSREAAHEALSLRSQFNVIDMKTGWKIDLIIRKDRPFSIEEFSRRQPARIGSTDLFVASPEDSILSKLEWSKIGGSERQLQDAANVLRARKSAIDHTYLARWAEILDVSSLLDRAKQLAGM